MNKNWNPAGNPRVGKPRTDQAPAQRESEFGQFESLTKKLVGVPKSELNEKRKKA